MSALPGHGDAAGHGGCAPSADLWPVWIWLSSFTPSLEHGVVRARRDRWWVWRRSPRSSPITTRPDLGNLDPASPSPGDARSSSAPIHRPACTIARAPISNPDKTLTPGIEQCSSPDSTFVANHAQWRPDREIPACRAAPSTPRRPTDAAAPGGPGRAADAKAATMPRESSVRMLADDAPRQRWCRPPSRVPGINAASRVRPPSFVLVAPTGKEGDSGRPPRASREPTCVIPGPRVARHAPAESRGKFSAERQRPGMSFRAAACLPAP